MLEIIIGNLKISIGILIASLLVGCASFNNLIYSDDSLISFTLADSVQLYPFQVLHVDSSFSNSKNNNLTQWEILRYNDTLSVLDGHLVLVHFGGAFISFEKGETIIINQLENEAQLKSYQNFDTHFPISPNIRPTIKHLFLHEGVRLLSGHTHFNPFIVIHPSESIQIGLNQSVCIRWNSEEDSLRNSNYKINIYNIYDDPIDQIHSDNNYLEFSAAEYYDKLKGDSLLIIGIEDPAYPDYERQVGIWILDNSFDVVDFCNIQDPALALQVGHYLEFEGHILGSLDMFELANELHPHSVYQELLIAFKDRNNLWN